MSCLMLTEMHNQALFTAKWFTLFRVETEKKLPYPVPAVDWYSTSTYLLPFTNVYASPMLVTALDNPLMGLMEVLQSKTQKSSSIGIC